MPRNRPSVPHSRPTARRWGRAPLMSVPNDQPAGATEYRLSKSRVCEGLQCHKFLWWRTHEPDAPELVIDDPAARFRMDQGTEVGELARRQAGPGELIDFPRDQIEAKLEATADAVRRGVPRIFEAAFRAGGIFVAVDILERDGPRYTLVEVKSTTKVKPEHIGDVGVQVHVLRQCGVNITRAEVMHLNPDYTVPTSPNLPKLPQLFVREDVTPSVEIYLLDLSVELAHQFAMLQGPRPEVPIGPHCFEPRDCPFMDRCWGGAPEHHVSSLYRIRSDTAWALASDGHETILELPTELKLSVVARRQVEAVGTQTMIVEPGLNAALAGLKGPIAYLDFETVGPAVPVWSGCHPYTTVPVQFSVHTERADGGYSHCEWLAEGPTDPRPVIARALIEACRGAGSVLMYSSFERVRIRRLAEDVPELADELLELGGRLVDLEPIVRNHVYHPGFGGSFSLKEVLPALIAELSYDDLEVNDGQVASVLLNRMLLRNDPADAGERAALRANLLAYCKLDTWAMVKLVERLRELASA